MAAASPALSNNSTDTSSVAAVSIAGGNSLTNISGGSNSSRNQRGLNKPKCIKCGNVARSRCPYQSCKSCCAKAQNPCHIHVLKGTSSLPDKVTSSGSPSFDQQTTDVSSGNSFRAASLRLLSNNFAQFNNLQSPLRSRKPLTKKEALVINEWRFLRLKEYGDRNIEAENDAFDRYMQNVCLLKEVFDANSTIEEPKKHMSPVSNPCPKSKQNNETVSIPEPNSKQNHEMILNPDPNSEQNDESIPNPNPNPEQNDESIPNPNPIPEQNDEPMPNANPNYEQNDAPMPNLNPNSEQNHEMIPNPDPNSEQDHEMIPNPNPNPNSEENQELVSRLKLKLRSDPERAENSRKRVRNIIDQGLKKLKKLDTPNVVYDLSDEAELIKKPKRAECSRAERAASLRDLTDKLSKARNEEDLNLCREIKSRIFDTFKKANEGESGDFKTHEQQDATKEDSHMHQSGYFPPKWFSTVTINQDAVNQIDAHFSSLEEIEDL